MFMISSKYKPRVVQRCYRIIIRNVVSLSAGFLGTVGARSELHVSACTHESLAKLYVAPTLFGI
jgi:hypothetical protein